jgi:alkanesulfonate monooxygenase SsuD/methylene tetrahydromethanopterin reductase-like flavin-dependent oxidoreductase (luciferase family)
MKFGMELAAYWPHHRHHIDNLFPELIETVKLADHVGFDSFLIGEHHFMDMNATPDPLALASYVAAITKRQRLVLAVLILPLNQVQRLAGEIAQIDQLSRGRIELGFGRGGAPFEFDRFCLPSTYEDTREIFEERLAAMKILFTQENVTLDWKYTKVKDVSIVPPIYQRPMPPMWQASMRPESCYHIAKQGFNVMTGQLRNPMSFIDEMVGAFNEGRQASGKPATSQKLAVLQWVHITTSKADREEKLQLAYEKQQKFHGLLTNTTTAPGGRVLPVEIAGSPEDYAETLVIGDLSYVKERVLEFKERGVDELIVKAHCGPDHHDVMQSLATFGEHVMPLMREEGEHFVPEPNVR